MSVFTLAQDYRSGAPPMPVLFTLHVSNRRALEFFCTNRPRFHEAMLSAVLTTQRGRRGLDTAAIGGRARAIVARFMKRDWLVGVDAKVVDSANEAGPEVLKTRDRCAELRS